MEDLKDIKLETYKFRKGDIWQINASITGQNDYRPAVIIEDTKKKDHFNNDFILVALISGSTNYTENFISVNVNIDKDVDSKIMLNNIIALPIYRFVKFLGFIDDDSIDFVCEKISSLITCKNAGFYEKQSENSELSDTIMNFLNENYVKDSHNNIGLKTFKEELENYSNKKFNPKTLAHILSNNGVICISNTIYCIRKKDSIEKLSANIESEKEKQQVHAPVNSSYDYKKSINKIKAANYINTSRTASKIIEEKHAKFLEQANLIFEKILNLEVKNIAKMFYNIIGDGLMNNDMLETFIVDNFTIPKSLRYNIKANVRKLMVEYFMPETSYGELRKIKTKMRKESGNSESCLNLLEYRIQKYLDKKKGITNDSVDIVISKNETPISTNDKDTNNVSGNNKQHSAKSTNITKEDIANYNSLAKPKPIINKKK